MNDNSTILMYIFLLLIMVITTSIIPSRRMISGYKTKYPIFDYLSACVLPILIYTLFWGLRGDNVGTDYIRYIDHYDYAMYDLQTEDFGEYTFLLLCSGLSYLGFSYVSMFIVTSLINILSVYISSWGCGKSITVLSVFFYFCTSSVFFAQNGIRQAMASSILLAGLLFIERKKYIPWVICIVIAFFTHHSSILFALFVTFLVVYKPVKINTLILVALYITMELLGVALQSALFDNQYGLALAAVLGYENNIIMALDELGEGVTYNSGLGIILRMFLNIAIITIGNAKLKEESEGETTVSKLFYCAFYIFYFGVLAERLFEGNMMLNRLSILFTFVSFPCIAHTVVYMVHKSKKNKMLLLIALGVILGFFLKYYMACRIGSNGTGFYHLTKF